jgi:hypothetical protein
VFQSARAYWSVAPLPWLSQAALVCWLAVEAQLAETLQSAQACLSVAALLSAQAPVYS